MLCFAPVIYVLFLCFNDVIPVKHTVKNFTPQEDRHLEEMNTVPSFRPASTWQWESIERTYKMRRDARQIGYETDRTACDIALRWSEIGVVPGEVLTCLQLIDATKKLEEINNKYKANNQFTDLAPILEEYQDLAEECKIRIDKKSRTLFRDENEETKREENERSVRPKISD